MCSGIEDKAIADALVEAYNYSKLELFNLRDFVFFLRYIHSHSGTSPTVLTPDLLLSSLQHNFNGIKHSNFERIVHTFFAKVQNCMSDPSEFEIPERLHSTTFVELLTERFFLTFRNIQI